jgi:hypothetical protein
VPGDLYSATAYAGVATASPTVSVEGFAMWSIYLLVGGGAGNNELILVTKDEDDLNDLASFIVSSVIAASASWQHFTFGLPGTTVPLVARRIYFTIRNTIGNASTITLRIFGRAW